VVLNTFGIGSRHDAEIPSASESDNCLVTNFRLREFATALSEK
jgi:hypothetical protein